jgi:predicted RNase H-like HicB family nuclease
MFRHKRIIGFRVEVVVEPDDVGFHAYCPALKGLHTCGDTEEEALQNVRDAATAYLQSLIKHGDPIPVGIALQEQTDETSSTEEPGHYTEDLKVACAI